MDATAGGAGRGPTVCTGTGLTRTTFVRVTPGLRCKTELRIAAAIPTKQSSRTEAKRAGTLKSPLPRYRGDCASPPMVLASSGKTRLLVTETINSQIASARITAMTTRPIHLPASAGDNSSEGVLGVSSINGVMQIVPQLAPAGKATGIDLKPIGEKSRRPPSQPARPPSCKEPRGILLTPPRVIPFSALGDSRARNLPDQPCSLLSCRESSD